jgi:hypothetical protein
LDVVETDPGWLDNRITTGPPHQHQPPSPHGRPLLPAPETTRGRHHLTPTTNPATLTTAAPKPGELRDAYPWGNTRPSTLGIAWPRSLRRPLGRRLDRNAIPLGELPAADPPVGHILVHRRCFHSPGCIAGCLRAKRQIIHRMSSLNDAADVLISNFIDSVLPGADGARASAGISSQGHIGHRYRHNRTYRSSPGTFRTRPRPRYRLCTAAVRHLAADGWPDSVGGDGYGPSLSRSF